MDISILLLFKNWATLMLTAKYVVKRNELKIKKKENVESLFLFHYLKNVSFVVLIDLSEC